MRIIAMIAISLFTTNAFAWTYPSAATIDTLHCQLFDSSGRYFCEDTTPSKPGQASNTLILDFDELVKMNAKPVQENSHVYRITSR